MNVKRITALLLGCVLAGTVLAGCGGQQAKAPAEQQKETAGIKLGMLTHMNASEEKINEIMKKVDEEAQTKLSHDVTYYDKLTSMQMGLESGSVKAISLYDSVAHYLMDRNDKITLSDMKGLKLEDSFCCAVRQDDKELKGQLDKVIGDMKADGTLDKLIKEYITDLKKGSEPPAVPLPKIDGAATLKIGITGDLPPLDLILPDGKAAGFNTAVLAELSKRLGKNVELVQVDSASRAAALASKKIDVVFWATLPAGNTKIPGDIDKPQGVELTVPYYQDKIVHVEIKGK